MEYIVFILGISMVITVAVQVFFRYVLNHSLFWSEELARYMLVWLTFLGASVAYRRGVHPGIDILFIRLPSAYQKGVAIFIDLISISLFAVMIYYGALFAHFVRFQISPALQIPKWVIFSIVPFSGFILVIHTVNSMAENFIRREGE